MAAKKTDKVNPKVKDEDRVSVMIPFVEGQDPEVTVIVNGEITKIKKGRQVKVSPQVAEVLENSNQQMITAMENRERLKSQRTDL